MNTMPSPRFKIPGSWTPPDALRAISKPWHETLTDFIHGCSPDPEVRTVATTALVLSLWQMKGRALTPDVPSLLLIPAGESESDPIDTFIRDLVYDEEAVKPKVKKEGLCMGMDVDRAPSAMRDEFHRRKALDVDQLTPGSDKFYTARNAELRFHDAQEIAYGRTNCRAYSRAWHPEYGLITDKTHQLILRLNEEPDRNVFCRDLMNDREKLSQPEGIGQHLDMVPKSISLSGSLKCNELTGQIVGAAIDLNQPLFVLPHLADHRLETGQQNVFPTLRLLWSAADALPVSAKERLPNSTWFQAYQTGLRRRLRNLPGLYEFAILQAVHQLGGVCYRIASLAGGRKEALALFWDLLEHTLRGMVLGVIGLSWHGLGLDLSTEAEPLRSEALRLLEFLRKHGPISKSGILQRRHLKKRQRDLLLEALEAEDLVRTDGTTVSATTYAEFVKELHGREEFPRPGNYGEDLSESRQ